MSKKTIEVCISFDFFSHIIIAFLWENLDLLVEIRGRRRRWKDSHLQFLVT